MIPDDLLYTKTHEWIRMEDDEAVVGITQFAQSQLGDLTFVELPKVGDTVTAGEEMGSVESVKAASEIYSPVDGEVIAVNEELVDTPEVINEDPYGEGWMVRVRVTGGQPSDGLLTPEEYADLLEE
ncbi:glycine cleavage system protein GcvH [Megalodesulfovibrio gigas]|uniref:Glycine cleavage system H protein n=1 Tax=Megalodesulfovibrio gigas (strain ATCC 19364 / DSM 1382 / NCIMB 9332 / VKM B-1759) TaxID=1121448 RepID=T2GC53_MEGG1|nr:glycine cleavage system protein GcvH [Megalodesulfovibrio gigas]AGW13754.1 putative glycine cleavage system H protein [Megalodesulfovibrio gigas DSM 1382 = ATCC 19364]